MRSRIALALAGVLLLAAAPLVGFAAVRTGLVSATEYPLTDPYFMPISNLGALPTDAAGIPEAEYDSGLEYNPAFIASQAIGYYDLWMAGGSDADKATFLKYSDWLVAHQLKDGRWVYKFEYGKQPVPWWSALAQGQGLAALARAYSVTNDSKYQSAAHLALETFSKPVEQLGVQLMDGQYVWYEEYLPARRPHTLNGFMFALIDLWEYHRVFNDQESAQLYSQGLRTLTHFLPAFDTGDWSCYSMQWPAFTPKLSVSSPYDYPNPSGCFLASASYQQIHVTQLKELYTLTGTKTLLTYANRWQAYLDASPSGPPPGASNRTASPASPAPSLAPAGPFPTASSSPA